MTLLTIALGLILGLIAIFASILVNVLSASPEHRCMACGERCRYCG